ncbi:MAG: tRNA (adenosine(37)-N6)-threonylcarbamoyltransferase complex dimerization subunit type 1 TsaB [Verrucomicrobiota bacterium]
MILAIETATPQASVALVEDGAVVGETFLPAGRQASETILSAVGGLVGGRGAGPARVSCVAVSAGPGSFTGLRVGMAAAKGFCYGWGVPMVTVPTLAALAYRIPAAGEILCPALDARKGEVYAALFRREGEGLTRLTPDLAVPPEALLARLPAGRIVFCGDALKAWGTMFRERLGSRARMVEGPEGLPSAAAVGILGAQALGEGAVRELRSVVPAYVRLSEAELRRLPSSGR